MVKQKEGSARQIKANNYRNHQPDAIDNRRQNRNPANRLNNQWRSASCYDLERNVRIESKLSTSNARSSSRSQFRNIVHDQGLPQYRSSSEPRLSFHRADILHSKEGSEANLTNYEDDNTSITGWR